MELITSLPDIIPDFEHDIVALRLTKLIKQEADLTAPILDCFGNLNLSNSKHAEVKTHLLTCLQTSLPMSHIPIVTKYLLNTCEPDEQAEVILFYNYNIYFA